MPDIHATSMKQSRADYLVHLNETFLDLASLDERQMENVDKILQDIIDRSRAILGADLIEFYEYFQNQKRFKLPQIKSGDYLVERVKKDHIYEDDVLPSMIGQQEPLYIETPKQLPHPFNEEYFVDREGIPTERFYVREKIKALAVIPIRVGDENMGLMFANFRDPIKFDNERIEIINLFAAQTAIVIRNARRYHQLYQRRKALTEVSMALASQVGNADQASVFQAIYSEAKDKLGMADLSLSLYDHEKDEIKFILAYSGLIITSASFWLSPFRGSRR